MANDPSLLYLPATINEKIIQIGVYIVLCQID